MKMPDQQTPDTREDAASKLPALHVLMVMGWTYLPPAEALIMRGSERLVLLDPFPPTIKRSTLMGHRRKTWLGASQNLSKFMKDHSNGAFTPFHGGEKPFRNAGKGKKYKRRPKDCLTASQMAQKMAQRKLKIQYTTIISMS
jgi:hypothetical protein